MTSKITMRQAPTHIQKWWSRTGLEDSICRAVELGYSWDRAHDRLKALHVRWVSGGARGMSPLLRMTARVNRDRAAAAYRAGAESCRLVMGGVACRSVDMGGGWWSSYFPETTLNRATAT